MQRATDHFQLVVPQLKPGQVKNVVLTALGTTTAEVLEEADKAKQDISQVAAELRARQIENNERWAAELARRFLPRYVINKAPGKVHAVRDAFAAHCGFEF